MAEGESRTILRSDKGQAGWERTKQRLQKVMAAAGLGSRRSCEQMILDGIVEVNGQIVSTLPVLVDPHQDHIVVDGKVLPKARLSSKALGTHSGRFVYYLLHKPKGVICTNCDLTDRRQVKPGRLRAIDLMAGIKQRLVSVGRLDVDSRGLLLMTNDGELVNHLTHPRHGVAKTYRLRVDGYVEDRDLDALGKPVWLAKGRIQGGGAYPASALVVKIIHRQRDRTILELTLAEGRNRQVRRMLARLGHKVRDLIRIKIGPLSLKGLPVGGYRALSPAEIKELTSL